ncbi:MAG: hypothetical protein ACFCBW_18160 [Candidatus Competibacterales bacterium]
MGGALLGVTISAFAPPVHAVDFDQRPQGPMGERLDTITQLDLTSQQWIALMGLRAEARDVREARQVAIDALREGTQEVLAADNPDLNALFLDVETTVDGLIAEARDLRASRLAFYNMSLMPEQQALVVERLRDVLGEVDDALDQLENLDGSDSGLVEAIAELASNKLDGLALSDSQRQELETIQPEAQRVRQQRRAALDDLLDRALLTLEASNPDLNVLAQDVEATVEGLIADHRSVRGLWLAFYNDSLTPEQQATVIENLRMDKDSISSMLRILMFLQILMADIQGPEPVDSGPLYDYRYCEILLVYLDGDQLIAEVWGTQSLNDCPQQQWEALDFEAIAEEYGALAAIPNGPRFFIVDDSVGGSEEIFGVNPDAEIRTYGELPMRFYTTGATDTANLTEGSVGGTAYDGTYQVVRDNVWQFFPGRRIYELEDPAGQRYVMQAYNQLVDPTLQLEDLEFLGERLNLPEGWGFSSRVIDELLEIPAVEGLATLVQDDLGNTYQQVVEMPCDAEPVIRTTAAGVDFVRTPDGCFEGLVDWPYESKYVEIDGLRQAYVDEGPEEGQLVL